MSLTYGSLCSGFGGLDVGVQSVLGGETSWFCEFDKAPSKILAHHWPDVPNLGDMTKVDWTTVPKVDVITAGYPCQPFSHAGHRLGVDDSRHLWPYIALAIGVLRPALVVLENVRGHLSLGFDEVVRDLHLLGYDVHWYLLRAADIGACHGRARLFIFAEDPHAERVFSRPDRRRGLHRDSGGRWLLPGEAQGRDDRQGSLSPASPDAGSWRPSGQASRPEGWQVEDLVHLAAQRPDRNSGHQGTAAHAAREGAGCGCRPGVSGDGGLGGSASEWSGSVDRGDARACGDAPCAHPGCEPSRPGPGASDAAEREAASGLPVGLVVGAGGRPVRPAGVRGEAADVWPDGGGAHLRAAGLAGVHERLTLLPTPSVADGTGGHMNRSGDRSGELLLPGVARSLALLPTPAVNDMGAAYTPDEWDEWTARMKAKHGNGNGHGPSLSIEAQRLLPTPQAHDASGAKSPDRIRAMRAKGHGVSNLNETRNWGDYEAAIRRHETTLGRTAPPPTETGPKGGQRLSPRFVEFMMMLPDGHVTDPAIGISRNDQLKALGNGVVPPQAAEATRRFLRDVRGEAVA